MFDFVATNLSYTEWLCCTSLVQSVLCLCLLCLLFKIWQWNLKESSSFIFHTLVCNTLH